MLTATFPESDPAGYKWTATVTYSGGARQWGVRCEFVGWRYVFALTVNEAPAVRIVALGCSIQLGRLLPRPRTVTQTGP